MNKALWQRLGRANWPLIGGMVFFLVVVVLLIWGYNRVVNWLMDEKQVPLRHVVVSGELHNVDPATIEAKVFATRVGSFFSVDVNAVQKTVESLPWVYRVSVRKKWPDILDVHVTEQQAVAVWNETKLLNTFGEVFQANLPAGMVLPKLSGPEGSEADALKGYRDLDNLLRINHFAIDALDLSARFSWQLTLKNGVRLRLGREEKVKRVQRFIDLYSVITARNPASVEVVDLRYDTGMAVRYATGESNKSS